MQKTLNQPTVQINNEAQLTNIFIKLLQAEIYTLEFRVQHESKSISDQEALKLRRKLISEFKSKVNALSQRYLEQKANLLAYELMKQEEGVSNFSTKLQDLDGLNLQLTF
ncbi:hypothetical protein N3Z17_07530 (plasmid) [Candidatus Bandiella numerosa]|uniref:hypothetical protein n=1 Tax=Candidatus Bandiella numerosa TaxID=2570586 RepID=UPI00249E87EA|nr:hypothetical protein [Candidatus Bandiella numerosa]WHA05681.1 hypothetical protein N3Z17_07530 [Candidatus Bandiella numerosa]